MIDTINQRVTFYRNRSGKNQEEVAGLMGLKLSTYSQMERDGNISAERLVMLADIFGITVDKLLYGDPSEDVPEPSDGTKPLEQPEPSVVAPPPFYVTNSEKTIITILRNLVKKDRDEVIEYIRKLGK